MAFIDNKTVLTDQEILATWDKPVPESLEKQPIEQRIEMLTLALKSRIRAKMWHDAYIDMEVTVESFVEEV